jgi:acetyl esterase/lipase
MLRLAIAILIFLLSLLTVFRAPTNLLWYVSILVTEFCWVFFALSCILLLWQFGNNKYNIVASVLSVASLVLFMTPVFGAYRASSKVKEMFSKHADTTSPFQPWRMIVGINAKQLRYKTLTYDTANALTLDFYSSEIKGNKPCVIVVHGGSWAGGDSRQLPELNSVLAKAGYRVASINYRLAPEYTYPAPVEDVKTALTYLRSNAESLSIDTNNFVLLGRSAGGQIVMSAAYVINDPSIKGVISFYGPADMVWGYANPTNPLVLNSRKVMEDYLGGTYSQVPQQYVNSSPTETAKSFSPATLLIYGENDPLVSHLHGHRLKKKLDSVSVKHFDVYLPWATHGFDWTLNGPAGQISTWAVKRFLIEVIGR